MTNRGNWIGLGLLAAGMATSLGIHAARAAEIEIDEVRLKPELSKLVREDLSALERMEIRAPETSQFAKLFGRSTSEVVGYLRERIHFIGKDPDGPDPDGSSTWAQNYGPSWLEYVYKHKILHREEAKPERVKFRDREIEITSPRTGMVVLGDAYTPDASLIDRVETLIHEARHSDCPALPVRSDLEAFSKDKVMDMSQDGLACTNVHALCPQGHDLAGDQACDGHPWGGYMVGYFFAEELQKYCVNCSEEQRQQAIATAKEDYRRLLRPLQRRLRAGTLPEPNMASIQ